MGITNSNKQIDVTQIDCDGTVLYCIGLIGSGGIDVSVLNDRAADPAASHVAVTPNAEHLDVSGGSPNAMCNTRNLKARFIAHNIDTDYRCCESVLTL